MMMANMTMLVMIDTKINVMVDMVVDKVAIPNNKNENLVEIRIVVGNNLHYYQIYYYLLVMMILLKLLMSSPFQN
jgi:hypothetical protein